MTEDTRQDLPLLRMTRVSKQFGSVQVLFDVSLDMREGEIHALMGENGAGKSTLMGILAGVHRPDSGEVEIAGSLVTIDSPQQAQALGIGLVPQELSLSPNLTVAENIYMGREPRSRMGWLDTRKMERNAGELLTQVGSSFSPSTSVARLSTAQQQLVVIAKALSVNARILIMDEPTSALSEREAQLLFEILRGLRKQGIAIVYISHRMEEVYELADRVTVLRDGYYIDTQEVSAVSSDDIVQLMVGRQLSEMYDRTVSETGDVALETRELTDGRDVAPTSLVLHKGEILGLAGLVGAGRSELAHLIFGATARTGGEMFVNGVSVDIKRPADAIRAGIGLVPESRVEQGLFVTMAVQDNIAMNTLPIMKRGGLISKPALERTARTYVSKLNIRLASLNQVVTKLSGGNQQKVVLARWLTGNPSVLLLDEPTRGVDVGARAEIYRIISELADDGVAILMISSELPEILNMSDRVLVMRKGEITAELPGNPTQEEVMANAT